jgi:hypothetical protein
MKKLGPGGEVTLAPGESVSEHDGELRVRFINVVEDSRCPVDTTCIWAGEVKALVEGNLKSAPPTPLREGETMLVGKHKVTLVRVEPKPVSTAKIAREDYRVTLRVAH